MRPTKRCIIAGGSLPPTCKPSLHSVPNEAPGGSMKAMAMLLITCSVFDAVDDGTHTLCRRKLWNLLAPLHFSQKDIANVKKRLQIAIHFSQ